jgi:hypothetical protein
MKKKAIIAIVVLILLAAYPSWKVHRAKTRVDHFSRQISVGMPIETAEALAQKLDLKIIRSEGSGLNPSKFVAWDGWAFARWTCSVSFEKNKVVGKKVLFLD